VVVDTECLDDDTVLAFVSARLDPAAAARVDSHVITCAACRQLIARVAMSSAAEGATATGGPTTLWPRAAARELLPAGATVSRYVIAKAVGAGAAGVVYEAWDPQLKRRVALKLVAPRAGGAATADDRLLREAEAMARLSHANVVGVYDAGTYPAHVFIVMELVEGETLSAWLAARPRPWREILAAFMDAGHGLAAAHRVGLVHRDFKPDNVLVGGDGKVRVTDFGLARPLVDVAPAAPGPDGAAPQVTAAAGTPLYMAPEQFAGRAVDARADQFSFAVALYMALYRRHPSGGPTPPPAYAERRERVPPRLEAVLRRALAPEPDQRWPDMAAFIDEIERAVGRGGFRPGVAAVVAVAAVALVAAGWAARRAGARRPVAAAAACGNGVVDRGEECDDGNTVNDDGCSAACLRCRTGDGSFAWEANGHCYVRHTERLPFNDAHRVCAATGDTLVTYTTGYESRAVRQRLLPDDAGPHWMGMRISLQGAFEWITAEPMPRFDWAPGEPAAGGRCATQTPSTLAGDTYSAPGVAWHAVDCNTRLPFICEHTGWSVWPATGHAYRAFMRRTGWPDARKSCEAAGAHLATIADADEQAFVARLARTDLWLGGIDGGSGRFEWVTGEPATFMPFGPLEPDEPARPRHILLGGDGVWHDRDPGDQNRFLCEID
jgi:cysteine-rich repeat protein